MVKGELGAIGLLFSNRSDTGRVREKNEDYLGYFREGERHLFVVADGMGGEVGGAEASHLAVAAAQAVFADRSDAPAPALLREIVAAANAACLERKQGEPALKGMGTTLELVLVEGARAWWGHVGDSRVYFVRAGRAEQLTEDHTLIQRLLRDGLIAPEEAAEHPQRHVLSRVVGHAADLEPDLSEQPIALAEGDALVLCSDGLADLVRPEEIGWLVENYGPQRACKRLVDLANERGGHDNITVQVVFHGAARRSWHKRRTAIDLPAFAAPRPSPARGRRRLAALAGLLMAGAAGVGAWLYLGREGAPPDPPPCTPSETAPLDRGLTPPAAEGIRLELAGGRRDRQESAPGTAVLPASPPEADLVVPRPEPGGALCARLRFGPGAGASLGLVRAGGSPAEGPVPIGEVPPGAEVQVTVSPESVHVKVGGGAWKSLPLRPGERAARLRVRSHQLAAEPGRPPAPVVESLLVGSAGPPDPAPDVPPAAGPAPEAASPPAAGESPSDREPEDAKPGEPPVGPPPAA